MFSWENDMTKHLCKNVILASRNHRIKSLLVGNFIIHFQQCHTCFKAYCRFGGYIVRTPKKEKPNNINYLITD